jgi:3-methyladenine DNA glycosylase AlkC
MSLGGRLIESGWRDVADCEWACRRRSLDGPERLSRLSDNCCQ